MKKNMVTLSRIIEGLEMINEIDDCYYNPEKDEIFLSNIVEYQELTEDEIDEYQIMVDFIETIDNDKTKEELQMLIQGKGAFRRFKNYCFNSNIIQDWYKYKEQKYREIAINWCKANGLKFKE